MLASKSQARGRSPACLDHSFSFTSGPAAPDATIAAADEFEVGRVAGPVLEARQLDLLLGVPAFAGEAERLHFGRGFFEQAELVARVLLGAEAAVDAGVAGDQPVPIHRDH